MPSVSETMSPDQVMIMARSLMTEHGVGYLQFGFHSYADRMGVVGQTRFKRWTDYDCEPDCNGDHEYCFHIPRQICYKITLSSDWIKFLPADRIKEVILHEIAHVKCKSYSDSLNHGPEWADQCKKLKIPANAKFNYNDEIPWEKDYLDPRNPNVKVSEKGQIL